MDALVAAIKARLTTVGTIPFFDGEPTTGKDAPNKYGVWYLSLPNGRNPREAGDRALSLVTLAIIYRGKSPTGCRDVAAKARAALEGVRLVPGAEQVHFEGTQVRPDDGVNPPAFVATDVARFHIKTA